MDEKQHVELKNKILETLKGLTVYEAEMVIKSVSDSLQHTAKL